MASAYLAPGVINLLSLPTRGGEGRVNDSLMAEQRLVAAKLILDFPNIMSHYWFTVIAIK